MGGSRWVSRFLPGKFAQAENPQKTDEAFRKAFAKSGDSGFELSGLTIDNPQGLFVPVSMLNELRRQLYAGIPETVSERQLPKVCGRRDRLAARWIVRTDRAEVLSGIDFDKVAEVVFVLSPEIEAGSWKGVPKNKLRFALPAVCRQVKRFIPLIEKLLGQGYRNGKSEIAGGWRLCRTEGLI